MAERRPENIIEQRGPFKILSREIMHDRFSMQLVADRITRPDGSKGEHFWLNFTRQAVLIFPLDGEGNIYLAEEFDYASNEYSIEASGGLLEECESPEEAARRELREELGVEVAQQMIYIGRTKEVVNRVHNITSLFLARVERVGETHPEPGEVIKLQKMPLEEAYRKVLNNEIYTAPIATGIFKIKLFLDSLKKLGN